MRGAFSALALLLLVQANSGAASPPPDSIDIDPALYDLGWKIRGAAAAAPRLVFDNGRKVFLKFPEGGEIPNILAETPSGLVLLSWISEPPYIAVPNLKGALRFRLGKIEAQAEKPDYFHSPVPLNITATAAAPEPEQQADSPAPVANLSTPATVPITPAISGPTIKQTTAQADYPSAAAAAVVTPTIDLTAGQPETREPTAPVSAAPDTPPQPPNWKATSGMTLHAVVEAWAKQANWKLEWNTDLDYPIAADFSLQGFFLDVTNQLFSAYDAAPRRFTVRAFPKMDTPVLLVVEAK
jgi:hypothetical protein